MRSYPGVFQGCGNTSAEPSTIEPGYLDSLTDTLLRALGAKTG